MIGHGSFGAVFLAKVVSTNDVVAIKKVLQDKRFKNRELQIMRQIAKHPHPYVVALKHHFISKGSKSDDVYLNLVLEYIPETVYSVSKHYNKAKEPFPTFFLKLYMLQLCRSLAHIHGMGICHRSVLFPSISTFNSFIFLPYFSQSSKLNFLPSVPRRFFSPTRNCRDIKPQNLLVDPARMMLKLCDFGSAKALVKGEPNVAYICSRYYRAPELIFGATDYTTSIDVWSAGCVMAELLIGSPIFPGSSGVDQLVEIIKVLGTPTKEQLKSMNPNYQEFKFPQIGAHPWSSIFKPTIPPETVDLVGNLLSYVPNLRCKAIEACGHPFFDDFRNPATRMPDGTPLPEELYQLTPEELVMAPHMEAELANYPGRGKVAALPRSTVAGDDAEA